MWFSFVGRNELLADEIDHVRQELRLALEKKGWASEIGF
jgi:hypothetical protein